MSRRQQLLEDQPVQAQDGLRLPDVADRGVQIRRGWNSIKDLTLALRFPSEKACRTWLRRHGVASIKRGRHILVDGRDVERELRGL